MSGSAKQRIQHLRGAKSVLQQVQDKFIPLDGEIILEKQNDGSYLQKIGNGKDLYKDLPYSGVATDETLLVSGAAADAKIVGDKFKEIIDQLAELNYKPITIDNFKISEVTFSDGATQQSNICEVGREITSIELSWQLNKPATELYLNGEIIDENKTSYVCESLSITNDSEDTAKKWSLKAVDDKGYNSKETAVNFYHRVYYGVASEPNEYNNDFILGLSSRLQQNKATTLNLLAEENEYIYYCVPAQYEQSGQCVFTNNGFVGGFNYIDTIHVTIKITEATNYETDYKIYRSTNPNLGQTTVIVS